MILIIFILCSSSLEMLYSATPVQTDLSMETLPQTSFFHYFPNLPDYVDYISLHDDFYGVPWSYFMGLEPTIPDFWVSRMQEVKDYVDIWDKPVFLSLQLVGGNQRSCPANNATYDLLYTPNMTLNAAPFTGCSGCFNFSDEIPLGAQVRSGFLLYVDYIIELYNPKIVNHAIELNLYRYHCGVDLFQYVIEFANEVYDHIKANHVEVELVFPSIQCDFMLTSSPHADAICNGDDYRTCFSKHYDELGLISRDVFGVSTYPAVANIAMNVTYDDDWFPRILDQIESERNLIAETGFLSSDMIVDKDSSCTTIYESTIQDAADYISKIEDIAEEYNTEMLTWFSFADTIPGSLMTSCPCGQPPESSDDWCGLIDLLRAASAPIEWIGEVSVKFFGNMGLVNYLGNPKQELLNEWGFEENGTNFPVAKGFIIMFVLISFIFSV